MLAVLHLISSVIGFYEFVIIAQVILSWLLMFGIVDRYNRIVIVIGDVLTRLTEPAYQPVRNFLHRIGLNLGGLDLSPLIVLLLLQFLNEFLYEMFLPASAYIR